MKRVPIALASVLAMGLLAIPATTTQAADDLCGWQGNVRPLMAKADRDFRKLDISKLAEQYFGKGAKLQDYKMMEVDLVGDPADTTPLDAKTLTDNQVAFNINLVTSRGDNRGLSLLIQYNGMCQTDVITSDQAWSGSTGVDKKLKIGAYRALKLAEEYREANPDDFPLDRALVMMNLMQPTTARDDFGKLRWYVNYDLGGGNVQVLQVYMDGTVKPRS